MKRYDFYYKLTRSQLATVLILLENKENIDFDNPEEINKIVNERKLLEITDVEFDKEFNLMLDFVFKIK